MKKALAVIFVVLSLVFCSTAFAQQTSAPQVFTIGAPVPVPVINGPTASPKGLVPAGVSAGASQFVMTVNGVNFQSNSVVQWTPVIVGGGSGTTTALATTFVSATQLTAIVPSTLLTSQGSVNITVLNPILVSQHQVILQWVASTTSGVSGYALYRSTTPGGPYTQIAKGITGTTATDATVENGKTYYYVSTAFAADGVTESIYSNEASAVIPA